MNFRRLTKKDYLRLMGNNSEVNQNHLIIRFLDFDFSPDLITKKMGLEPTSTGQKGEEYFIGPQKENSKFRECSHWDYEWKIKTNDFICDLFDRFFKEIIISRIDSIKNIGLNCKTTRLIIVQYYYSGQNPGYGFVKEQIKILADINAEVDMDIYCLCEENSGSV
jgi:hypothetical protein